MPFTKKTTFSFNHADQQDAIYKVYSAADIKQKFDSRAKEVNDALNAVIDVLQSTTDGDSGADNIGATAIPGLTGSTVQSIMESLKNKIDSVNPVAGFVNVKDPQFGAKGDGVTDDTAAIQTAIDSLNNGGIVHFPPGIYRITQPVYVTLKDNVILLGNNATINAVEVPGNTPGAVVFQGQKNSGITTVTQAINKGDAVIYVANAQVINVGDLIVIRSSGENFNPDDSYYIKSELAEVVAVDVTTNAITLKHGTYDSYDTVNYTVYIDKIIPIENGRIENIKIVSGGAGLNQIALRFKYYRTCHIINVTIEKAEYMGILIDSGLNAHVLDCCFRECNKDGSGYGVAIGATDGALVSGNKGYNNRHSIDVGSSPDTSLSRNVVIKGNLCEYNTSAGISTHGGCEFVQIEGNIVKYCGGGIIGRGRSHTIANNIIQNCTVTSQTYFNGISLGDDAPHPVGNGLAGTNVQIIGNKIVGPAKYGIYSTAPLVNAVIADNVIKDVPDSAITLIGNYVENVAIINNVLDCTMQTVGNGIYIRPYTSGVNNRQENVVVTNNNIQKAYYSGIRIEGCSNATTPSRNIFIQGNMVKSINGRDIDLILGYFAEVVIRNNVLKGNYPVMVPLGNFPNDTPVIVDNVTPWEQYGGKYTSNAPPTTGTWKTGDIVWNTAPTAGGYIGWVCVASGTPGTWKGFGAIQT